MNGLDGYKKTIVSGGGMTSVHVGKRFNFVKTSIDTSDVF
jgi:hypothetical protein